MKSKITGVPTKELFTATVLNKYTVRYYKCLETGFIQTEEPYWLDEAYSSAITKLDVGLLFRNQTLSSDVQKIISEHFDYGGRFLDYAGGYGVFTRMMRDKGFDFYHTDKYCTNIFAEYFELEPETHSKFELVTVFEVFEHMTDPVSEEEIVRVYQEGADSVVVLPSETADREDLVVHTLMYWLLINRRPARSRVFSQI